MTEDRKEEEPVAEVPQQEYTKTLHHKATRRFEIIIVVSLIVAVLGIMVPGLDLERGKNARQDIVRAVEDGDLSKIARALDARADVDMDVVIPEPTPESPVGRARYSLVSYAAKLNRADVVRLLLARGAMPDGLTWGEDRPPIFWAAENENEEIYRLLRDAGASDKTLVDTFTKEKLAKAIESNDLEGVLGALKSGTRAQTTLKFSVAREDFEIAAEVYSLVSFAAKSNHPEIVKLLLEHKADANGDPRNEDRPPIFWAASNANEEIFGLLIAAGADINAKVKEKTALEHAQTDNQAAAEFLRKKGA